MNNILPETKALSQEINEVTESNNRPTHCKYCGSESLWNHGYYCRKAKRHHKEQGPDPTRIARYYCSKCKRTISVLPDHLCPKLWYSWEVQEEVLKQRVSGVSTAEISRNSLISRFTCSRWVKKLKEEFLLRMSALRSYCEDLGRYSEFNDFWRVCLEKIGLRKAMLICEAIGGIKL